MLTGTTTPADYALDSMTERNTRSNASKQDCTELDNPVAVPHLGDLDAGDRVLIGDRSRPLTVVDTGVRVMRDPRADTGELRTPVVKLRGDWEGATEIVLAHQVTRWEAGDGATEIVLRERETIVETDLGREVEPRWTHVSAGEDSDGGREVPA